MNESLIESMLTAQELAKAYDEAEFLYVVNYLRDLSKQNKLVIHNQTGKRLMNTVDIIELDTGILAISIKEQEV